MTAAGNGPGVALVTGGARGIGAASARALVAAGWRVVVSDVCADIDGLGYSLASRADLDATVAGLGDAAVAVVADVRHSDDLEAAVAVAVDRFGGLDAVVAAAGVITGAVPSWTVPEATVAVGLDVNLLGVWRTVRAAIPALLARPAPRAGRIVVVASAAAAGGRAGIADYAAAKAGVVGLVRSLAVELGAEGVTVNAVSPGSTGTDVLAASAAIYGLADAADFAAHHPVGRLVEPDEVAAAVAWLCGPERGAVTGVVLPVDGGMTA